jgi:hypothetical protein
MAVNPTLTGVALALHVADTIVQNWRRNFSATASKQTA